MASIINGRGSVGIRPSSVSTGPSIVTDGLKLYLDAGNTSSYPGTGTVWTDISGNGNNGTLVNGGSGLNFVSANGGSLQFDGTNDYIRILTLNPYLNNVNKFTYQTWIKITNLSKFSTIFSFGQADNYNNDILFFYASNILGFQINKGADGGPTLPYTSTGWNNISIVYDGTQTGNSDRMKVYINGVLGVLDFNTYTVPSSTSNIGFTNAGIGAYSTGNFNNPFTGNISVSKLYNRSLSATEVTQNYNALKSRYGL
jgi:hypothetical protein